MTKFRDIGWKRTFRVMARMALATVFCRSSSLVAAEIASIDAARAAKAWVDRGYAMGVFSSERTVAGVDEIEDATTGARLHVVKFEGGGFVVLSADDLVDPVLAFSATGKGLATTDDNPLWTLLRGDIAARESAAGVVRRASSAGGRKAASSRGLLSATPATAVAATASQRKWSALLGGGMRLQSDDGDGVPSISDMRVAPLVQSQWGQAEIGHSPCFNFYTPNNDPCGCVATAGAQIMRYFQWPASSMVMPPFANPHCKVDGVTTNLTTQGGSYDWENMPLDPFSISTTISLAERQAIGKLTSDIGICCGMQYYEESASIGSYMLAEAFTNHFGYGSALVAQWQNSDQSRSAALKRALVSNFDAGLPVVLSLKGVRYGHAVVGDGYGYSDGAFFIHLNFGWTGISDAWYSPPNLYTGDDDDYNYDAIDGFVFNILTNMPASTVICSGRVLDADGNPVAGAVVSYCPAESSSTTTGGTTTGGTSTAGTVGHVHSDAKGIYALTLPPGRYKVYTSYGGTSAAGVASEALRYVTLSPNVATKTEYPNQYWQTPSPVINNLIGQDLVLSSLAGVAAPEFDPPSCLFYPTTNVSITCATSGATIRYTLDGTEPTETSTVYTGPIVLSDDAVITAKAWADGMNPSVSVSATYTYDASQGAPKGDYFADPILIAGASGTRVVQDNSAYTVEAGEPYHTLDGGYYYYQYNTIWYEWTAPGTGTMRFSSDLLNQAYGTYIAVYVGDSLSSLNRICYAKWTDGQVPDENGYYMCAPAVAMVNVEQGVTYRIVGMVQSPSLFDAFTLTWSGDLEVAPTAPPLEVTTSVLPPATSGVPYAVTLEAAGGVAPYTWSTAAAAGYDELRAANSFSLVGTARSWQDDDTFWELSLPFAFPFYGSNYQTIRVGSNGVLSFDGNDPGRTGSSTTLAGNAVVAPLWGDLNTTSGDIYVESSSDHVTIRWEGVYYGTSSAVSFSATLYADGTIRFRYGAGNASGGFIGISNGKAELWGVDWIEISQYVNTSLANVQDIVFTPQVALPAGLSLSSGGVISGTPTTPGVESVTVFVTDSANTRAGRTFNLTIEAAEVPPPPVVSPGTNNVIACESNDAALDVAATMNGSKATYIKAPETAGLADGTAETYASYFAARADGSHVVIEMNAAGTNALEAASTNVAAQVAADLSAVAATADATAVAVTGAEPGFYYSVVYDDDLTALGTTAAVEGPRALANAAGAVTLPIPAKKANATAGFYRVKVSVRAED